MIYDKITQITFSPTGGTKKVADIISGRLGTTGTVIDLMKYNEDFSKYDIESEGLTVIAAPVFGGLIHETAIARLKQIKGKGSPCVVVAVYGNRAYDDGLLQLKNTAGECGFKVAAAVGACAEHSIWRQFGTGRPDSSDARELTAFAEKIKAKLESGDLSADFDVPGNPEHTKASVPPMVPKRDGKCTSCGKCAKVCPENAINLSNPKEVDGKKCKTCLACVAVCPENARKLNGIILKASAAAMKSKFVERKTNDLFL